MRCYCRRCRGTASQRRQWRTLYSGPSVVTGLVGPCNIVFLLRHKERLQASCCSEFVCDHFFFRLFPIWRAPRGSICTMRERAPRGSICTMREPQGLSPKLGPMVSPWNSKLPPKTRKNLDTPPLWINQIPRLCAKPPPSGPSSGLPWPRRGGWGLALNRPPWSKKEEERVVRQDQKMCLCACLAAGSGAYTLQYTTIQHVHV